ncbi:uncharacterized protein LOC127474209 [Manacus candei]|uniref:uncharacterized protein LOC127474209 n=1 Tax=Manacus candei TaxID=415023 RepID=UPI002227F6CE|nr:uncharacterized protein LOC127474209 [Manacus candei]XP_051650686.1 uncharacterized protein LOC127474209 [Manacus candei]
MGGTWLPGANPASVGRSTSPGNGERLENRDETPPCPPAQEAAPGEGSLIQVRGGPNQALPCPGGAFGRESRCLTGMLQKPTPDTLRALVQPLPINNAINNSRRGSRIQLARPEDPLLVPAALAFHPSADPWAARESKSSLFPCGCTRTMPALVPGWNSRPLPCPRPRGWRGDAAHNGPGLCSIPLPSICRHYFWGAIPEDEGRQSQGPAGLSPGGFLAAFSRRCSRSGSVFSSRFGLVGISPDTFGSSGGEEERNERPEFFFSLRNHAELQRVPKKSPSESEGKGAFPGFSGREGFTSATCRHLRGSRLELCTQQTRENS